MKTILRRLGCLLVVGLFLFGNPPLIVSSSSNDQSIQGITVYIPLVINQIGRTFLVSKASNGEIGNQDSTYPSITADGRFIAFVSLSSNLIKGEVEACHPGCPDIFVRDRLSGKTELISVASDGTKANGNNGYSNDSPFITPDGRYVSFCSTATNLVPGDTNGLTDTFVHDRLTGITERVSISSNGSQGTFNGIPLESCMTSMSADGRYVAFVSLADNLVQGDTNKQNDVFVHDRQAGVTELVSVASDGTMGNGDSAVPAISADGRYVSFNSWSNNLTPGDTNGRDDVFVHDRQTGTTERVSVAPYGNQANSDSYGGVSSISADGRFVVFASYATNLVSEGTNGLANVFVHDRQTGITELVSKASDGTIGNSWSAGHSISADGRYIVFESMATNLVSDETFWDYDVFVHDRQTGKTELVSEASDGTVGNSQSLCFGGRAISADGRFITFESQASNLDNGDTNGRTDIFIRDRCQDGSCVPPPPPVAAYIFFPSVLW